MSIEKEIQQEKFKSEAEKAIVNISYTNGYLSNQLNNALKSHNISMQQFNVLRILQGQHPQPVSINQITSRMVDKMSNASRLVDKLCSKEFVKREKCPYDKRQVDIKITPDGQKTLKQLNQLTDGVINNHTNLNNDEFARLNELLDKLRGG